MPPTIVFTVAMQYNMQVIASLRPGLLDISMILTLRLGAL